MIPVKFKNSIDPFFSKSAIPIQQVKVTNSPFTVKSLGLRQYRYKMLDTSAPDFSGLSNLDLLDDGITHLVGFYAGLGAPTGLSITDNIAIRYSGNFYTDLNSGATSFSFKVIGFGKIRIRVGGTWILGSASTYQTLDQHTYNEVSISLNNTWEEILIDYYSLLGETGFAILWKDNVDKVYIPLSAGVTSEFQEFETTSVLNYVTNISTLSAKGDVSSFSFEIPIVASDNTINGYKYDKSTDRYIDVLDSTKFLKKYSMIECEVGYKNDNKVLNLGGPSTNQALILADISAADVEITTQDFMVEAWVKFETTVETGVIISKADIDDGYTLRTNTDGTITFGIMEDTTGYYATSVNAYNDGNWHHVAGICERGETDGLRIFIDGSEVTYSEQDDISSESGSITNAGAFCVGSIINATFFNLQGQIDEVRVWNFGINGLPADINQIVLDHYNFPHRVSVKSTSSHLKARWIMQETDDTPNEISDVSGNGNSISVANDAYLNYQEIGSIPDRSQRTSDSNYETYVKKFVGHVIRFELQRSNKGSDIIRVYCEGFESFLKTSLNLNFPDKFDYWISEFGGLEYNDSRPDGIDFPPTFDGWPLDKAFKALMIRANVDPSLFYKKRLFLNNAGGQVEGEFLIEESNPRVILEKARNYGGPSIVFAIEQPDDEYRLKTNFGDTIFDYINKVVEPYGWEWGCHAYYDGAPYLKTRNNPTLIKASEGTGLTYSGSWNQETNLDVVSGTYRDTIIPGDYIQYTFAGQKIDMVSVLYRTEDSWNGGTQAEIASSSSLFPGTTDITVQNEEGDGFAVNQRIVVDIPGGSESSVITFKSGNNYELTPELSIDPVSGTLIRTAVASAEIRRGQIWAAATPISTVYLPGYHPNGLETVINPGGTSPYWKRLQVSGAARFYYHGVDQRNAQNPTLFNLGTDLSRDYHTVRITRLSNTEAGAGATLGFNAFFIYDQDRNLPVQTFRTGDALASGTLIELDVKNSGEDIRNDVIVVGRRIGVEVAGGETETPINPNNPVNKFITSRAIDINSLQNKYANNFIGRPMQTILIEPSIGSQDRADYWSVNFLNRFRFPGKDTSFQSLGHPLMEIGDCISVDDEKKDSIETDNTLWIENIENSWGQKKAFDRYEASNFPPYESFIPKIPVNIADFNNEAIINVSITNGGSVSSPYDPYDADDSGTFVTIDFDMVISGHLRIEVFAHTGVKIADLLNPNGDEGQKGFIKETFGSNKQVTWDGVDLEGSWNEAYLREESDFLNLKANNWYVAEYPPFGYGKFYLKFTVVSFDGTIYTYFSNGDSIYVYTLRGTATSLTATFINGDTGSELTFTPLSSINPINLNGFTDTDNPKVKITTTRSSQINIVLYTKVFGLIDPASFERYYLSKTFDKVVITKNEFATYTNQLIDFDMKNFGFIHNDLLGTLQPDNQDAIDAYPTSIAFMGWYFVIAVVATDKSGRSSITYIPHYWEGSSNANFIGGAQFGSLEDYNPFEILDQNMGLYPFMQIITKI